MALCSKLSNTELELENLVEAVSNCWNASRRACNCVSILEDRGAALLVLYAGRDGNLQHDLSQRLQPKFPARRTLTYFDRSRVHANHRLAQYIIPAPIAEDQPIAFNQWLVILSMFGASHSAHLKDVHKISIVGRSPP